MTRGRFIHFTGVGALVGGALWLLTLGVGQMRPDDLAGLLALPALFLVLGLAGLQVRHATGPGALNRAGVVLTLIGALLLALGSTGRVALSGEIVTVPYGPLVLSGVAPGALVLGIGAVLIAISAITANVLPRLSPIPLLVGGAGVASAGGLALARQWTGLSTDVLPFDVLPLALLWALFGFGWMWLGYLLWAEREMDPGYA